LYAFIKLKLQVVDPENEFFVCGGAHFHLNDNVSMQTVGLRPKTSSRNLSASSLTASKGVACRFQFFFQLLVLAYSKEEVGHFMLGYVTWPRRSPDLSALNYFHEVT
jgi:hypothetical protein